jgi:CHAT domain-containing protein
VTAGATKSEALRLAQIALIKGERFSHPAFWGPFLLIGNWM